MFNYIRQLSALVPKLSCAREWARDLYHSTVINKMFDVMNLYKFMKNMQNSCVIGLALK